MALLFGAPNADAGARTQTRDAVRAVFVRTGEMKRMVGILCWLAPVAIVMDGRCLFRCDGVGRNVFLLLSWEAMEGFSCSGAAMDGLAAFV